MKGKTLWRHRNKCNDDIKVDKYIDAAIFIQFHIENLLHHHM